MDKGRNKDRKQEKEDHKFSFTSFLPSTESQFANKYSSPLNATPERMKASLEIVTVVVVLIPYAHRH